MANKPGRNDPCHCGSGQKYKKCCSAKDDAARSAELAAQAAKAAEAAAAAAAAGDAEGESAAPAGARKEHGARPAQGGPPPKPTKAPTRPVAVVRKHAV